MSKNTNTVAVTLAALLASAISPGENFGIANDIMKDALAQEAEAAKGKATTAVRGVLSGMQAEVASSVQELRAARQVANEAKEKAESLTRAFAYFVETSNPLPFYRAQENDYSGHDFCRKVGIPVPKADHAAWSIPAGWKPSVNTKIA